MLLIGVFYEPGGGGKIEPTGQVFMGGARRVVRWLSSYSSRGREGGQMCVWVGGWMEVVGM